MNQTVFNALPKRVRPSLGMGKVADYIPALGLVPPDKFGIFASCISGKVFQAGDYSDSFSLQSISKVFALIMALQAMGDACWDRVGRSFSTKAFNAISPLEDSGGVPRNPFTNGGAMVMVDQLITCYDDYPAALLAFARKMTGNPGVGYDRVVAESEKKTGHRNAAIAQMLKSYKLLDNPVEKILDTYFLQCSLAMNCADLSRTLLFLANRGTDPVTQHPVIAPLQCRRLNALLLMFGTYAAAGDFVFRIGLPGKTGVGGGISVIVPGKMSIAVWSPPLDEYGTSVAGLKALEILTETMELSIL